MCVGVGMDMMMCYVGAWRGVIGVFDAEWEYIHVTTSCTARGQLPNKR